MKFKAHRKSISFEYEFLDGSTCKLKFLAPTTQMIESAVTINETDLQGQLHYAKETLKQCLDGSPENIEKLFKEQLTHGDLYSFRRELDQELGKHISRV